MVVMAPALPAGARSKRSPPSVAGIFERSRVLPYPELARGCLDGGGGGGNIVIERSLRLPRKKKMRRGGAWPLAMGDEMKTASLLDRYQTEKPLNPAVPGIERNWPGK
jgi:hypothetical protein